MNLRVNFFHGLMPMSCWPEVWDAYSWSIKVGRKYIRVGRYDTKIDAIKGFVDFMADYERKNGDLVEGLAETIEEMHGEWAHPHE